MTHAYRTAAAFKQALEQRLRTASTSGTDLSRRRQLVVFDRFLARVALEFGDPFTLKGGLALELRVDQARTTNDVDLRVMGASDDILGRLRVTAGRDMGDFIWSPSILNCPVRTVSSTLAERGGGSTEAVGPPAVDMLRMTSTQASAS